MQTHPIFNLQPGGHAAQKPDLMCLSLHWHRRYEKTHDAADLRRAERFAREAAEKTTGKAGKP